MSQKSSPPTQMGARVVLRANLAINEHQRSLNDIVFLQGGHLPHFICNFKWKHASKKLALPMQSSFTDPCQIGRHLPNYLPIDLLLTAYQHIALPSTRMSRYLSTFLTYLPTYPTSNNLPPTMSHCHLPKPPSSHPASSIWSCTSPSPHTSTATRTHV
jgi:hypothetical protein